MRISIALLGAIACNFTGARPGERDPDAAPTRDARPDAPLLDAGPVDPLADCTGLSTDPAPTITLSGGDDLSAAIGAASAGAIIELGAGTYALDATIDILVDDLTIRGANRLNANSVVIAMSAAEPVFSVQASRTTIGNLRITGGDTQIVVTGSALANTSGFFANNIVSVQSTANSIRAASYATINGPLATDTFAHDGLVFCSQFAPDPSMCDSAIGVRIDDADGWRVSKNSFVDYDCANAAALQIRTARNPIIDRNLVRHYSDAIVLGELANPDPGSCDDSGASSSVFRALVCNNDLFQASGSGVGVFLGQACQAVVVHNTLYQDVGTSVVTIHAAEANSVVFAANNLSNGNLTVSQGATFDTALLGSSQQNAPDAAFSNPASEVLTPVVGSTRAGSDVEALIPLIGTLCSVDRQGRPRDLASPRFVGAYED